MECAMRGDRKWRERDRTGNSKKEVGMNKETVHELIPIFICVSLYGELSIYLSSLQLNRICIKIEPLFLLFSSSTPGYLLSVYVCLVRLVET